MYAAIELSKYIVTKCVNDDYPISNLQLQKILFYIQKEFLKLGNIAFSDDIEAWPFGPVVPNVYYQFCSFGAMPITSHYSEISISTEDANLINNVIEKKRILNPWDMVAETHKKNGAWDRIFKNGLGNHNIIPLDLIKSEG